MTSIKPLVMECLSPAYLHLTDTGKIIDVWRDRPGERIIIKTPVTSIAYSITTSSIMNLK